MVIAMQSKIPDDNRRKYSIKSRHLVKFEFYAGGLAFAGADDDALGDPAVARGAGLEEGGAAEIIAAGLDRPAGGERRHHLGRAVAQRQVADIDQRAVVGLQRIARLELRHAIAAQDLPIGAARQHLAADVRPRKLAAGDRDDAARALADVAAIERRAD